MFGGMFGGMFGDMMKMFQGQGPIQWDTARQIAQSTATGGRTENNIDPRTRIEFENLARIAALQVHMGTGIGDLSNVIDVLPDMVTPGQWAQRTLDDYRPLFTDLATALGTSATNPEAPEGDPFAGMFANLTGMLAPMTMGMTVGSMVGLIAKRSLGQYDLPLPARPDRDWRCRPTTSTRSLTSGIFPSTTCACGPSCARSSPTRCTASPTCATR